MKKYIIYFLLLFSTTVFSQNYFYALDKAKEAGADSESPTTPQNLVASNITEHAADLTWTEATDNVAVVGYNIYINNNLIATTNNTSYNLSGLTSGTTYTVRVTAFDALNNESEYSNSVTFTTSDNNAPTAPQNLVASNITENSAQLTWNASTDNVSVLGYNIYNNGDFVATVRGATNYALVELNQGTEYNITVRAYDEAGNESNESNIATFITLDIIAPTTPLNLVASNITENSADLTWSPASDNVAVIGYNIYNQFTLIQVVDNITSFTLTNLTESTTYNLIIRAIDAAGNESEDSNIEIFTTNTPEDTQAPTVPRNLIATNITETTAEITWTASTDNIGVTGYNIFNNGTLLTSVGNITNYTLTGLNTSSLYNLTITAFDAAGNESAASNNEDFTTVTPTDTESPTDPSNLVAFNITETTVDLTWTVSTDNVGIAGYLIYKTNNGVSLLQDVGNINSFTLTGLTEGSDYSIIVRAYDTSGNQSGNTNTVDFTTLVPIDTQAPTAPLNLIASNIGATSVNLIWSASTDNVAVTGYNIYNDDTLLVTVGNITNFALTGLDQGTIYNLTLRAIDASGNESTNSNTARFTTLDSENPSIPINLTATNITENSVSLNWTAATDNVAVTGYNIYNNVTLIHVIGNETNYELTGLVENTEYNIFVRAFDAAGNESEDSNVETFTTTTNAEVYFTLEQIDASTNTVLNTITSGYSAPVEHFTDFNVNAIPSSNNNVASVSFNLTGGDTHNQSENVAPYALYGDDGQGNYTAGKNLTEGDYTLLVTAWSATYASGTKLGESSFNFTVLPAAPDSEAPTIPTNFVATNVTNSSADLSWSAATDNVAISGYNIYNNGELIATTGYTTNFNLTGLTEDTIYNLTLKAIDVSGNASEDSNTVTITTLGPDTEAPTTPLNLTVSNITDNSADLSWTAATDNVAISGYNIYNNGDLIATTDNITNFILTDLSEDTTYSITLKAFDIANNESQESNLISFTTLGPDTETPTVPLNLTVTNITETTADLNWTAATDNIAVTGYNIYNNGTLLTTVDKVTSYTISGLTQNTFYNLTVRALDDAENESEDSNAVEFTTLANTNNSKTYSLTANSKVSIGVYDENDVLLRTLTQYEDKAAGTYNLPSWDGLDNDGNNVSSQGDHYKVVSNNLQAEWEGVIGNTSDSFTGQSVWARFNSVKDILIIGNDVYCAFDYSEGHASIAKFDKTDKHKLVELQKQRIVSPSFTYLAYDGTYMYMAGHSTTVATAGYTFFSKSTLSNIGNHNNWENLNGEKYQIYSNNFKVGNLLYTPEEDTPLPTGIAVQQNNENLYLAREFNNTLTVINKNTGVVKQTITTFNNPKHCKIDTNGNLWIVHGSGSETLEKFTIDDTTGNITTTGFTITGFTNIQGIDISPDGNTIAVNEAATYDQVFGYNTSTSNLEWTLGRTESYADNSRVYKDKFLFTDIDEVIDEYAYVHYDSDNSLWVNDKGNQRQILFDSSRNYVDQISYLQGFYQTNVDNKNNSRVFADWLEYKVDYSKALLPDGGQNGAWELTHNWGISNNLKNMHWAGTTSTMGQVVTLSNNRTYTMMRDLTGPHGEATRIWELVDGGGLRDTGTVFDTRNLGVKMLPNDTMAYIFRQGGIQYFYEAKISFDSNNNVLIGNRALIGTINESNGLFQNTPKGGGIAQYTSNGDLIVFQSGLNDANNYHLGAYDLENNQFKFKSFPGITYNSNDEYPLETGTYDARESVTYAANGAWVMDNIIMFVYHGEFWRNIQTNYMHLVHETGLPLIDFGVDGFGAPFSDSIYGMAGNSFGSSITKVGNTIYIYQNDESWHAGLHRWKIENIDSIKSISIKL
ncbi:hypothetical protein PW52_12405 [Tamlana sedimentorum]|uniref:Fibronectin type-III domain-containing protein n=1 Tax=Neotamlana sedimentorum TaxID=1435349 RepID=A0A0D7W710_9FLAO|nr:fibronectin type III domain-containing protein [Tamlana sedimentorum]KJD34905.1 hypothetical protein PW52_12405 [Tamlana sedimentorum]